MKKKSFLFLAVCMLCAFMFTACDKNNHQESRDTLSFEQSSYAVELNDSITLSAVIKDKDGKEKDGTVTFSSGNEAVAKVTGNQLIALSVGTATLTASAGELTAASTVTVEEGENAPFIVFDMDKIELLIGGSFTLEPSVSFKGKTYTDAAFGFSPADSGIATVSDEGLVSGIAYGSTSLTVTAAWRGATGALSMSEDIAVKVNEDVSLTIGEQS